MTLTLITRRAFFLACVSSFLGTLSACASRPRYLNYRFTLVVVTPDGERTGSSVVSDKIVFADSAVGDRSMASYLDGEATVVDLGSRGVLVATFVPDPTGPRRSFTPFGAFGELHKELRGPTGDTPQSLDRLSEIKGATVIPLSMLPMLVRFANANDPTTIEHVDPADLAAKFGPGVALLRATVEITADEPTTVIWKIFPWLIGGWPERWVVAPSARFLIEIPAEKQLTHAAFKRHWP